MNPICQIAAVVIGRALAVTGCLEAAELQVALSGNDANPGTVAAPLWPIQKAADLAHPGDVITVHSGVYSERIDPPRGGASADQPIVYQAAVGEKVEIKGLEIIKGWKQVKGNLWSVSLPNSFFGTFNPYTDLIHGDYMSPNEKNQCTGMVYLNGMPWIEAASKDELEKSAGGLAKVQADRTTLWGVFKDTDPNLVEIYVRRAVFCPSREQVNYLTVRGFHLSQAATNWAPPTADRWDCSTRTGAGAGDRGKHDHRQATLCEPRWLLHSDRYRYFGKARNEKTPSGDPFELSGHNPPLLKVR